MGWQSGKLTAQGPRTQLAACPGNDVRSCARDVIPGEDRRVLYSLPAAPGMKRLPGIAAEPLDFTPGPEQSSRNTGAGKT